MELQSGMKIVPIAGFQGTNISYTGSECVNSMYKKLKKFIMFHVFTFSDIQ